MMAVNPALRRLRQEIARSSRPFWATEREPFSQGNEIQNNVPTKAQWHPFKDGLQKGHHGDHHTQLHREKQEKPAL